MIRSMTGFGRARTALDGIELTVELASVNRRNLEVAVFLPRDWQALERELQGLLRDRVQRGKLTIQVQAAPAQAEAGFHWDEAGLESTMRRMGDAAYRHGVRWRPTVDTLVRLAALNKVEMQLPPAEAVAKTLCGLVETALEELLAMRAAEGAALARDLRERAARLHHGLQAIRGHAAGAAARYRELLLQRLAQAGLELNLDDERVLRELALFADKCDISEELTRLDSHLGQFRECLEAGSPVGRKLEFILQEVGRELNTIGSKATQIEVSRLVIEAKNELERVREQIQNIE